MMRTGREFFFLDLFSSVSRDTASMSFVRAFQTRRTSSGRSELVPLEAVKVAKKAIPASKYTALRGVKGSFDIGFRSLKSEDIERVSRIHGAELPGFLSKLGSEFLEEFYRVLLDMESVFTYVYEERGLIYGFATGTVSSGLLKTVIFRRPFKFGLIFLGYFITHPFYLANFIKALSYPGLKQNQAELLTIAVDRNYHKRGVGKRLLDAICKEFRRRGINSFMVSVYDRLPANGFYKKMGFEFEKSFEFLGERMNYYEYDTKKSKFKIQNSKISAKGRSSFGRKIQN